MVIFSVIHSLYVKILMKMKILIAPNDIICSAAFITSCATQFGWRMV